ncbi:MAG: hypothetical protein AABW99_04210, partial [archaeon]
IYSNSIDVSPGNTVTLTFLGKSGTSGNTYYAGIASDDYNHQSFIEGWESEWAKKTVTFVVPQAVSKVHVAMGIGYNDAHNPVTTSFDNVRVIKS